jgi:DNA polymerase-3 subunit chi
MAEIHFYHLTSTPVERALPKLLEKALQGGFRSLVLMESEEKVEWMNNILWTYDPNSFLPHGSAKDGNAEEQPIYITASEENPTKANLLVITDGSELEVDESFNRVIDIFDGTNETATQKARARWKKYKDSGHALEYRQQNENGSWVKNA